ncbi:hypothetical protein ACROYT_G036835 [Oculina patagonica]
MLHRISDIVCFLVLKERSEVNSRKNRAELYAEEINSREQEIFWKATEKFDYLKEPPNKRLCGGCGGPINDRFLLKALDRYWHEDCLKCGCCECRLGEVGSTLYTKANLILCRRDYLRLFGTKGFCTVCCKTIPAFEMVMRARENVYHLECFSCQRCHQRFCVGDKFYLINNRILCVDDYEEMMSYGKPDTKRFIV